MGCSHGSKKASPRVDDNLLPPAKAWTNEQLQSSDDRFTQKSYLSDNQYWWLTYTSALKNEKSNSDKACESYTLLGKIKNFPLQDVAYLKAQIHCPEVSSDFKLADWTDNPWLSSLTTDLDLKMAKLTPSPEDDILALIEHSKKQTSPFKKEKTMLQALELSRKSGLLEQQVLTRLKELFPRYLEDPSHSDWLKMAEDYRTFRQFKSADSFYRKIVSNSNFDLETQWSAWKGLRLSLKTQQNKPAVLRMDQDFDKWFGLQLLSKSKKGNEVWWSRWQEQRLQRIRQLWTEDQTLAAQKLIEKSLKQFHFLQQLSEFHFVRGKMFEEKKLFSEAQKEYETILSFPDPGSAMKEKVLWSWAWILYKQEQWSESQKKFSDLLQLNIEPSSRYKYLFWKGRCEKKLSMTLESQNTFKTLIMEDPLGFYGVLAHRELQQNFSPIQSGSTNSNSISLIFSEWPQLPADQALKLDWLVSVKDKDILEPALQKTQQDLQKTKDIPSEFWLRFFSAYTSAQLYLPLFSNLGKLDATTRDGLLRTHPEIIFPQPYDDWVLPSAQKNGIRPSLVYAIMRQESAFNPEARSPVDAMGLLQLLPSLGNQIARKNNIPFQKAEDLFIPEINIQLGSIELKSLLKKFRGNYILAIANYNANESAIKGWLKTRYKSDPVEFIEEIPYEETRTYVKLVLRNIIFYERLGNPSQATKFPEELLTWM